jgi:hypothetical protein
LKEQEKEEEKGEELLTINSASCWQFFIEIS